MGKKKLRYELRLKGVNTKIIDNKINEIKEDEYLNYFDQFSTNKIKYLKGSINQKEKIFHKLFHI